VTRVLTLAGVLIFIIGLGILWQGGARAIQTWQGFPGWPRAQATILRVYKQRGGWHAVMRFEDGGRVLTYDRDTEIGGREAPLVAGRTMTVIYPPGRPDRAFFDWKTDLGTAIWTAAILGLFLMIFGWILAAISLTRPMVEALGTRHATSIPRPHGKKKRNRS